MKITVEYEGQPIVVDISDETLKKIAGSQKKKTGWEKPTIGDDYWYIGSDNCVIREVWSDGLLDNARYDSGNCFTSEQLAANVSVYKSLDSRIRRRISEICEPLDWKNRRLSKYEIVYDWHHEDFTIYNAHNWHSGQWVCDTEEHAKQIIEEFKDELTWYFTEFKDRMDG